MKIRKMGNRIITIAMAAMLLLEQPVGVVWASEGDRDVVTEATMVVDAEKAEEYVTFSGGIYSMGYELEVEPYLLDAVITVTATCEDGSVVSGKTTDSRYSLELKKDKTYTVHYKGYISGRMANLNVTVAGVMMNDAKEVMNVVIRTKNVAGWNANLNSYAAPASSILVRNLNSFLFSGEVVKLYPDDMTINVSKGESVKNLGMEAESGIKYEKGFTYVSSDEEIATVDDTGKVTAKKAGKVTITVTASEDESVTDTVEVNVVNKKGFNPEDDGYCFENGQYAMYFDPTKGEDGERVPDASVGGYWLKDFVENTWHKEDWWFPIPYERFHKLDNTLTEKKYLASHYGKDWGGNCFGMSATAALFYAGKLDVADYNPKKYAEGETVNAGAYDGASHVRAFAGVSDGKVSELTALIEEYQIWQDFPSYTTWQEKNRIPLEQVLNEWDEGKPYLVILHGRFTSNNKSYDHAVLLNNYAAKPEKTDQGTYILPIYDCNYPVFTDITHSNYAYLKDQNRDKNNVIKVTVSGDSGSFEIYSANNSGESSGEAVGDDITFYRAENLPVEMENIANEDFETYAKIELKNKLKIYKGLNGEKKVIYEFEDGVEKYKDENLNMHFVAQDTEGNQRTAIVSIDDINITIELPEGGSVFFYEEDKAIGSISESAVTVSALDNEIAVECDEDGGVILFNEDKTAQGEEIAVYTGIKGKTNDTLATALSGDEFTISSNKTTPIDVLLSYGDEEKTATITASKEQKVDIIEYVENPPVINQFADVAEDAWYYTYVWKAYNNGIMNGTDVNDNGLVVFQPLEKMSRAQFVQVLYAMEGKPAVTYTQRFNDVSNPAEDKTAWYSYAVLWAAENGITSGYDTGDFGVNDAITREQMATMLFKYVQVKDKDVSGRADLSAYVDAALVSDWATVPMQWAVNDGIMSGAAGGYLNPEQDASRAEGATMLNALYEKLR